VRGLRQRIWAAVEAFRCDPNDQLRINGIPAAKFAKRAYDLGDKLDGPGRFDPKDPTQQKLQLVHDWIEMARHDALESRKGRS
jgi:hypothetical protein